MTTTIFRLAIDYIAQYFVVLYTPVFAFWLIIHSQIGYWRRMGKKAYWMACLVWPIWGIPILIYRKAVFAIRFPTPVWAIALGILFALLAVRIGWLAFRNISRRTLVGLPELEPGKNVQPLLNTGIYARTRNPIYFMHSLAIVALALLTGFAANWALLALDIVLMPLTLRAEERELLGRYGDAYREYMRTVPRFFPNWPW